MVQAVEVGVEELADVERLERAPFLEPWVDHAVAPVEVELAPVGDEEQVAHGPV